MASHLLFGEAYPLQSFISRDEIEGKRKPAEAGYKEFKIGPVGNF
jgi:hypothetical protein